MNNLFRPSAAVVLFVAALLVACEGANRGVDYNPAISQELSPLSSPLHAIASPLHAIASPLSLECKAKQEGPLGTFLSYVATGNVKGTTFTATSSSSIWVLEKYTKVKPTPTPTPSPTPSPSPSPTATPKPVSYYFYVGAFAMKNKQIGCAYLITTVNGKPISGEHFNGEADGFPNLKSGSNHVTVAQEGKISSLVISHLSAKGGSGSATLIDSNKKPYTTGSITLTGREVIKEIEQVRRLMQIISPDQ
jgi:hypothetical protein